jgi:hypothetical protein
MVFVSGWGEKYVVVSWMGWGGMEWGMQREREGEGERGREREREGERDYYVLGVPYHGSKGSR